MPRPSFRQAGLEYARLLTIQVVELLEPILCFYFFPTALLYSISS